MAIIKGGAMIRGTTPTHTFTIPFDVSQIVDLRISYAQGENEIIVKSKSDCLLCENIIQVTLTQEDTFKFDCSKDIKMQVRVLKVDGEVKSSNIKLLTVGQCLNEEVLK